MRVCAHTCCITVIGVRGERGREEGSVVCSLIKERAFIKMAFLKDMDGIIHYLKKSPHQPSAGVERCDLSS